MFCGKCGRELKDDQNFCPVCGCEADATAKAGADPKMKYVPKPPRGPPDVRFIGIFCAVWAIIAVAVGIIVLASNISDNVWGSLTPEMIKWLKEQGFTEEDIRALADMVIRVSYTVGVFILLSGILAGISAGCCFARKKYTVALYTALFSTILALVILVGLCGFVFVYLIHRNKDGFDINPADTR